MSDKSAITFDQLPHIVLNHQEIIIGSLIIEQVGFIERTADLEFKQGEQFKYIDKKGKPNKGANPYCLA